MKKMFQLGVVSLALATVIGCSESGAPQQQAASTPPPPPIDVASVSPMEITDWYTYTSRIQAPEEVQLKPRVSGIIESVNYREGDLVQQGEVLFTLDQRPFNAEVKSLEAQLERAKAALKQAESEYLRATKLNKTNAISAEETEARRANFDQRQADVSAITASLNIAKLNLEFSSIEAPISGRASIALHTKGNTVNANSTVLTSIVSTDAMYAYFDIDERTWNSEFNDLQSVIGLPVRLELIGSKGQSKFGKLDFVNNTINPNTGTLKVRARFDNADHKLMPGAFARVSIAPTDFEQHIVVPDRAIGTDLKNKFILVVNEDNSLGYRPITVGKRLGDYRIVESGLKAGETIVVNGPAKVGPGMTITPRSVSLQLPENLLVSEFKKHMTNEHTVMGSK
ncbi:efflux RND transporter periplasmic adaptor subunit [Psychrosphaera ytuae]|uniref:Efflux RND transporter periplasmic adaptor subunit n=1 Tax=Psychrosphaera ytuae TaxID=2820710 RepID=A0A975DEX1_9GAMM|nr:efflux RND transporter periplasmic adaptor subunit [Psychrosphaera ytuae]QTH64375.1 efflux RND transporter periplasmic adaptor subunit [Psychrosphaera ytuae]